MIICKQKIPNNCLTLDTSLVGAVPSSSESTGMLVWTKVHTFYFLLFFFMFRLFISIQSNKRKPVNRDWAPIPPPDTYPP